MTTVVANPSGRKSAKDKKANPNKNASPPTVTPNSVPETINNNNSEEFRNKSDKFQPTAEQMRIASLMTSDKKDENDLKPKIEQIVELTGASRDDAAVALFDCDNDMAKAIEMILDGDSLESEWHSTGRKKKTKAQIVGQPELLTNGTKKTEKSSRPNLKNNNAVGITAAPPTNATKGQGRGAFNATNKVVRKKDGRPSDPKPETVEESDIFAKASTDPAVAGGDAARRGSRRGAPRGGRGGGGGIPRGKGPAAGRGSRTFMNRGLQNNDGFPNSIETWTNSTAEQTKPNNDDLNTMTVGNWSDIAANEDWSEEDWTSAPLETKVFTPSTKTISEKDEIIAEQNSSINSNSQNSTQLSFVSPNKNEESAPPTMSAILSGNIKRSSVATPGQALLQQIQQSSASQNSNLNQYNLSQYSKQATESIKSLVGLSSNNMIPNDLIPANEHSLDSNLTQVSKQPTQTPNQQNRLKVQNQKATSKIPETAVEMPSNDPISNLSVHFGSLEFGTNNPYGLDPNMFDSVNQNANAKQENKNNLSLLASNTDNTSNSNFRSPNSNANQNNKSILQSSVLPPTLNDSLLNTDHRNEKPLNANNYASNKQQIERKNEYMNMTYKPSYVNNENAYSSAYQTSIPSNVGYYSNSNQVTPFGNSTGQSMMTSNVYNTTYNNVSANAANNQQNVPKIRDIDNSVPQQQQVAANSVSASNKPYESASNVGTSLSLMSNSTVTTNVLKNTLSASKGVHNVPPGVQPTQVGQVLQAPYIMSNAGMPIPYPYPYEMQSFTPRDHGYPYAAADVKYNRGAESDMLPVSSQAAGAVQTATQAHNQPYMNTYPPGYGVYFTGFNFAHQGLYNAAQHALYPVPQAQTTAGSAGSAFAKANTAASYGSHSYNSGYDSLGAAVAQTQDYVNKAYPQQMQPHKQMSGTNTGDLSGNNPQNMYNKTHSQMNKNYEKQGFQQSAQFNLANTTQSAANLSSYAAPYLLPQQSMHHTLASAEQTQQPPGVGNQRSLSQTHKGASSNASYGKFNWN